MSGLRPTVVGLIGAAALIMITPENFPDWKSWIIFVTAFVSAFWLKAHPILILLAAGVAGFVIY